MVFPTSGGLPVVVEIAPGAAAAADPGTWTWTDVSTRWLLNEKITITEGRGDWGTRVDTGTCRITFRNNGDFSQFNPAGQWYGLLGRDTPLRVRLRRGVDAFARTVSAGWGTADSGQAWSIGTGSAADISVSGGVARHAHTAVGQLRRTKLAATLTDCEQLFDVSTSALLTGAALVSGGTFRETAGGDYYWLRVEFNAGGTTMMLKITKVVGGVYTDLGVLNPLPGMVYAANTPVRVRASVAGEKLAIKAWAASGTEPSGWQLTVSDESLTAPGAPGVQSWLVSGNTNTLPVVASFDTYYLHVDLWGGYVPAWVPSWDQSGKYRTVQVTARGTLYRLQPAGSGKPPKRSPLRRTITAAKPAAYWPVEDGAASGQAASAIAGHPSMAVTGTVGFAPVSDYVFALTSTTTKFGTSALASLAAGGQLAARVPTSVTTATATGWRVHVTAKSNITEISGNVTLLEWDTPGGTYVKWRLVQEKVSSYTTVYGIDAAGTGWILAQWTQSVPSFSTYEVTGSQSGGTMSVALYVDGGSAVASANYTAALAGITQVAVNTTSATSSGELVAGHIAVWAGTTAPYPTGLIIDSYNGLVQAAIQSYNNEAAVDRIGRLVSEDGITFTAPTVSSAGVSRMGWQTTEAPLPLYQQCEDTDGGVLYERPFALAYQPREARYNQAPALTLNAQSDLADPPAPDATGQGYRNRWTAERVDGSTAVAQTDQVTAGTAVVYDDSVTLSVSSDAVLADQAGWRVHLTADERLRWPQLSLDLAARPALIDTWLNCRVGSRIQATNPPADVAGQDIDVILEGHTTTLGYNDWDVQMNCSPAAGWDIALLDGEQRVASDGSTLAAGITAAATTFQLASTATNGTWTTDPADFPLDVAVGGERVRLSAITGTTSPQTATVATGGRAINGVSRAWPAGTAVDVWAPAITPL